MTRTSREEIRSAGDAVGPKVAKFTNMQFAFWKTTVTSGNIDNGTCNMNYSIAGNNCMTWSALAAAKAVAVSLLPLYP